MENSENNFLREALKGMKSATASFFDIYSSFNRSHLATTGVYLLIFVIISFSCSILWTGFVFYIQSPHESYFSNLIAYNYRIIEPLTVCIMGFELVGLMIFGNFIHRHNHDEAFSIFEILRYTPKKIQVSYIWLILFFFFCSLIYYPEYGFHEEYDLYYPHDQSYFGGYRYSPLIDRFIALIINPFLIFSAVFVYFQYKNRRLDFNSVNLGQLCGLALIILSTNLLVQTTTQLLSNQFLPIVLSLFDNLFLRFSLSAILIVSIHVLFLPGRAAMFGKRRDLDELISSQKSSGDRLDSEL